MISTLDSITKYVTTQVSLLVRLNLSHYFCYDFARYTASFLLLTSSGYTEIEDFKMKNLI